MGSGAYMVIIDEFALSKPETFQRLYPLVFATNGQIIIQTTPRGKNHAYELFNQVINDEDWLVQKRNVFDLGIMTQEEYDKLLMHPNYKAQEYLCSWESPFENAIYIAPQIKNHQPYGAYKLYAAIDIGYSDKTVVTFAQEDLEENILITHCFSCSQTKISEIIQTIYNYVYSTGINLDKIFVPHDGRNNYVASDMSVYDKMYESNLPVELIPMRGVNEMIEVVREKWHEIYFDESCSELIEAVKAYVVKNGKPIHCDYADSLRYLIYGIVTNIKDNYRTITQKKYNFNLKGF